MGSSIPVKYESFLIGSLKGTTASNQSWPLSNGNKESSTLSRSLELDPDHQIV